jgi:hypothetical protein
MAKNTPCVEWYASLGARTMEDRRSFGSNLFPRPYVIVFIIFFFFIFELTQELRSNVCARRRGVATAPTGYEQSRCPLLRVQRRYTDVTLGV